MNRYDTDFIKSYIMEHQEEIEFVFCGMKENWLWTADEVYSDGEFIKEYDWSSKSIKVAGITGSAWATPVMEVTYKSGKSEIIPCFFDDGEWRGTC